MMGITSQSFESVYQAHRSSVENFLKKRCSSKQDAEDIASEVFYYCFKHFEEYDSSKASVTTWIYLITRSRLANYYRDRKSYDSIDEMVDFLEDEGSDIEKAAILDEMRAEVIQAMLKIPEAQRSVLYMKYFLNKKPREIAQTLGMTEGNVRQISFRALSKLKMLLNESEAR